MVFKLIDVPLFIVALLDEPAHFLTAAILLVPLLPLLNDRVITVALASSVLLDADHIPALLGGNDARHST